MSGIVCVLNNYEDDDDQEKVFYGMIDSYLFVYFSVVSLVLFPISSFLLKILFSVFLIYFCYFLSLISNRDYCSLCSPFQISGTLPKGI